MSTSAHTDMNSRITSLPILSASLALPHVRVAPYVWMASVAFLYRVALLLYARTFEFPAGTPPMPSSFGFGFETGSIAGSIATGHGFSSPFGVPGGPTTWIAPIYPYFCAAIFKILGVFTVRSAIAILTINSVFSALTCIPIYLIAERTVGRQVGLWAGWTWAVVPFFMRWPITWVWDMSLSALLMALLFLWTLEVKQTTSWKKWLGLGFLWGFAALSNPALLAFLPASAVWLGYHLRDKWRQFVPLMAIAALACSVVVAPWMIRNRLVFGEYVFIRGNFGFEFDLGNYHYSNGMGWFGHHPTQNRRFLAEYLRLGERAFVAEHSRQAMQFVRQYPGEFAQLCLRRFTAFWDGTSLNYVSRFDEWRPWMFLPLSLSALWGLMLAIGQKVKGSFLAAGLLLLYPIPYYLTYPAVRYRHAIEPEMLILSVYFLYETVMHFKAKIAGRNPDRIRH
jgi:4-amino-4-deoxy-L-arabinose transferase-like glycosyltransferase